MLLRWSDRTKTAVLASWLCCASVVHASDRLDAPIQPSVQSAMARLPLVFEENQGQALGSITHVARGPGYQIAIAPTEAIVNLVRLRSATSTTPAAVLRRNVRMRFLGANTRAKVSSAERQIGVSNYLIGASAREYLTAIPHFGKVEVSELYPGIDAIYYGNQAQLEFDLRVRPGAEPRLVRLQFDGAESLRLHSDGSLALSTDAGELRLAPPRVYQETPQGKRRITAGFLVASNTVSLRLGGYDHRYPLIIDPTLSYGVTIGGSRSSDNYGISIAVNSAGEAYIAGWTSASDFPTTTGAFDRSIGTSDTDVFVLKLNAAGTALVYSTFLGGRSGVDYATGIAIDSSGNAYVTGRTSAGDFPTSTAAYQQASTSGGSFITKLTPTGSALVYSTYLLNATTRGIAVDSSGNAVVVGDAAASFATTSGAFQTVSGNAAGRTAFVFKLNASGSAPVFSTFLGGSGTDQANAVALDTSGNAFIAGTTTSSNFPLQTPFQSTSRSTREGFVSKLAANGTALVYSTYLGGSADDWANSIAVDASGSAYVAGTTGSGDFPVLNAFQSIKGGHITGIAWYNGFVTKLTPSGTGLVYSTFLGGDACPGACTSIAGSDRGDEIFGIAINQAGNAFVSGRAISGNFPSVDSIVTPAFDSNSDYPFIAKIGISGNALLYSNLLDAVNVGGSPPDGSTYSAILALATDSSASVYGTGNTKSLQTFPTTTTLGSNFSPATIIKLTTAPPVSVQLSSSLPQAESGQAVVLTAVPRNPDGTAPPGSISFFRGGTLIGSASIVSGFATLTTTTLPIGVHRITAVYRANETDGVSPIVYQLINSPAQCN